MENSRISVLEAHKYRHLSHVFLEEQNGDEINSKLISSSWFRILLEPISHFVVLPQQGLTLRRRAACLEHVQSRSWLRPLV